MPAEKETVVTVSVRTSIFHIQFCSKKIINFQCCYDTHENFEN